MSTEAVSGDYTPRISSAASGTSSSPIPQGTCLIWQLQHRETCFFTSPRRFVLALHRTVGVESLGRRWSVLELPARQAEGSDLMCEDGDGIDDPSGCPARRIRPVVRLGA